MRAVYRDTWTRWCYGRSRGKGRVMQAVRFAGDQALVANSNAGLRRIEDNLNNME